LTWQLCNNSISPEWECSLAHSGINREVAAAYDKAGVVPEDLLAAAKADFERRHGAAPTYGDHLVTEAQPLRSRGISHIIHVLGADCSDRGKRHPVRCFEPKGDTTGACVFTAYLRCFCRADALAREHHGGRAALGMVQISTGVFGAEPGLCARMLALAARSAAEVLSDRALHAIYVTVFRRPVSPTKKLEDGTQAERPREEVEREEREVTANVMGQVDMIAGALREAAALSVEELRQELARVLLIGADGPWRMGRAPFDYEDAPAAGEAGILEALQSPTMLHIGA